jgi:heme exporter protein CcmD
MHDYAPYINGSYGASVIFLLAIGMLTYSRYQRARKRLQAVETR